MKAVRVKICGITKNEDLITAEEAGADAVGFVVDVPSSPRNLTLEKAQKMLKHSSIFVKNVVVTVPKSLDQLTKIYEKLRPDVLQIHGDYLPDDAIRKELPNACLIRAVQAKSDRVIRAAIRAANTFDAILVDSFFPYRHGGTGKVHDWELSKLVKDAVHPRPLILAGGLKPQNVKEAIHVVRPHAVDVSSGVESRPGIKDSEKIFEFVKNAKEA